jgi:hypothetical protein
MAPLYLSVVDVNGRLIFSLSCSSGKAAKVPKPASFVIASSQIRIPFDARTTCICKVRLARPITAGPARGLRGDTAARDLSPSPRCSRVPMTAAAIANSSSAAASAINSGAGRYGPLAGKKKRALAVDPGLPIRPPNVGGTGRAVASSLLRSGGAVERGAGAPRPRRFQRNYTASLNLN